LFQLRCRLIDDRRNFGDLFGRQIELLAKLFLHSNAYQCGVVKFKENMPSVQSSKESAGNSPGDEYEDESRDEFPLQRAVHFKNSSWIAESAMANSFEKESPSCSRLCLASRTAASVDMTITAADNSATRRRSRVRPFALIALARQSATTRVSKPIGARQDACLELTHRRKLQDSRSRLAPHRSNRRDEVQAALSPIRSDSGKC